MFLENVDWMCDYNEVCYYFDASSYTVCIRGDECYSPEEALDNYFAYINGEYDDQEDFEFNWEDWRSNFDMSGDYWFYDADMAGLFPYPMFEDNVDWMCDDEEVCFFFNANDYEVCIRGDECYSPEEALDLYFAHKNGEYDDHEDSDFNWDDWRSNFDLSDDYWFYDADLTAVFPHAMFLDNVDWMCDYNEVCYYFDASSYTVCIRGDECYSPEDALDNYFAYINGEYDDHEDDFEIEHHGVVWGESLGWCASDLDEPVYETYSVEECWTSCVNEFGEQIVSVDFSHSENGSAGECYCQNDCGCLKEGSSGLMLMTAEWMEYLPESCE
jgi:hypothetical protein